MGRACFDRRERRSCRLTSGRCRPAGSAASRFSQSVFTRPGARAVACLLGLAAALFLLPGAKTAQAQTSVTLVSNTGQSTDGSSIHDVDRAQSFTTGSNPAGYTLTSVTFPISGGLTTAKTQMRIESSNASGQPGGNLGALTITSSGGTATGTTTGIDLAADTTYFVVLQSDDPSASNTYDRTNSDSEDSGAAAGWSIGDGSRFYTGSGNPTWGTTSTLSWKIAIHGYANPPAISSVAIVSKPRIDANNDGTKETYGAGQKIAVDVTWGEDVAWDTSATGAGIRVQLGIGSNTRPAELVTGGATSGTARTLRFAYTVVAADTDTDGVTVNANSQGEVVRLRGGATVKKADGSIDAKLTHAGLGAQSGHLVNGGSTAPTNSAPTFGGDDPGTANAPVLTLVNLPVDDGDFSDADGDPLTFKLSLNRDDVYVPGEFKWFNDHVWFMARSTCALANLSPPVTGNPEMTFTFTATDPDGASGSVTGVFNVGLPTAGCPSFSSAEVSGTTLTITLDGNAIGGTPGADEFEVKVAGTAVALWATSPPAVSGRTVTLTLATAPAAGQTVTVSYTPDEDSMTTDSRASAPMAVAFTDRTVGTMPTLANPIPDTTAVVGTAFSYQFPANTFNDPDGDTLSYTATLSDDNALPGWLSFAAGTRTFSGTPEASDTGTVSVKVTATDGTNSVSDTFDIAVTAAPTVANAIPDQTATVNAAFSYQFAANTFNDADGDTLTYTATQADGTALPGWLSFAADTRTFSGTPTAANVGTVSVKVTATDGTHSVSDSFDIAVVTTIAPTAQAGADRTADPGATVTLSGSGTDSDGTIQGYAWSQVSGTSVTLQNANTAQASFTAPDTAGPLVFRLTVTDNLGATDTDDVTVTVNDVPPIFTGSVPALRLEPGAAMTPVVLPEATGGNGGPYTYGLSSEPAGLAGLSFDAATRTLSGTPDVERGRWTFTYWAHDGDDNVTTADAAQLTFTVQVGAAPEMQRRAVKSTVAALATRTVASALDTIGARLGGAVPETDLILAGESVPFSASGAAAGLRDSGACPVTGFGADGIGRGGNGAEGCGRPRSRGVDADALLSTSAFSLTLGAAEGEPGFNAKASRWSVWGRGDLGHFAGRPEPGMHYRGETLTGWLGVDARGSIRGPTRLKSWVAGLAVSHGTSKSDYSFEGGADPADRGRLETVLSALWPYGSWTFENGLELRGILGAGTGSLRHFPGGGDPAEKSRLTMWTVSLGFKRKLQPLASFDLAARGDASFVRKETARGEQTIDGLRADSWRGRFGLEGSRRFEKEGGRSFTPFLELAARQDGGDGLTGTGLEVAGGLRHGAPGLDIELRGRWLAAHTKGGTEERGVSLTARMLPGERGRGLSLSLTPRWGAGTGGADALWHDEMPKGGPGAGTERGALDLRVGYGYGLFGDRFTGTPNLGFGLSDSSRDFRIGWRLTSAVRGAPGFEANLDATRREAVNDIGPARHGIMLGASIRW